MIKLKNISKKYGDSVILENSSYIFPQRGIVCLMGASGSGKTTLLNLLAGFDTDYKGEILIGDTSISTMNIDALCRYRKDHVGFVFQDYHLLPGYTVLENILLACELSDESMDICREKAKTLLKNLDIAEKENQMIENLSGGQKQRVAIARALISNPQIIFADEPTGALDRATSTEIMELLRKIAQNKLVIVITHDPKIGEFADEIIHIKDKKLVVEQTTTSKYESQKLPEAHKTIKFSSFARASKNFHVHIKRYIAVSLVISIGILTFLFSLSFGNIMEQSIESFKEKNTAFNNGFIKGIDDGTILKNLKSDNRIENVYYQYKLNEITLSIGNKIELMPEKYPTPKATEDLSYGVMPRYGMSEIAITPSLAKKFDGNIKNLLGNELILELNNQKYTFIISGIYNAGYDDFLLSSDIEQQFYVNTQGQDNYSISYDVSDFTDIVDVSNTLDALDITSDNASKEVATLQKTFNSLNKLFFVISILILSIGLFICAVLLIKLQNSRYKEVGLLSALGFSRQQIAAMISSENMLLSSLAGVVNLVLLGFSILICNFLDLSFSITIIQIILSLIASYVIIMLLSYMASYKLIRTEAAIALKK